MSDPVTRLLIRFLFSKYGIRFQVILSNFIHNFRHAKLQSSLHATGARLKVQFPLHLYSPERITIGNDVSIAAFVHMWGGGGIKIGDRVMIGSHTAITSLTHDYTEEKMYQTLISKSVIISDDVWIGSHCCILPGITIGSGAVIGAGCVVTKDVPARAIVAGIPGNILRYRPN